MYTVNKVRNVTRYITYIIRKIVKDNIVSKKITKIIKFACVCVVRI